MGISRQEWEDLTPAELNIMARAHNERIRAEQELTEANLYSLAALIRPMIWAKTPPSFERIFGGRDKDTRERRESMTDDEMYAVVVALNAALGGEVS